MGEDKNMHKLRNLNDNNNAVVGIIVAFLITGLIVIVLSVVQTVYVPKWMEQNEADHMETVADQFSQLKFAIDTQSALKSSDTPISTSITLGNKEMPYLMSARSYGSLEIKSDECIITITNATKMESYNVGIIKYCSVNTYFLNQDYIYENGAVILCQDDGNTMQIKPSFSADKQEETTISFTITNIKSVGGKESINGYGTYPIQTEYPRNDNYQENEYDDVESLRIDTNYQNAWECYINKELINSGLDPDTHYTINSDTDGISVVFLDTTNINLKLFDIYAQISPGWIENERGGY